MGKQPQSSGKKKTDNRMQKVYREFTRVKFKKYKLQFPRLRESQIVTKILREWEAMNEEEKDDLQKQFIERSGLNFLAESSSSSKKRKEEALKAEAALKQLEKGEGQPKKKKKKTSPKVRVYTEKSVPKASKQDSDLKRSEQGNRSGKKSTPDKDKSSGSDELLKTKPIHKGTKSEIKSVKVSKKQQYVTFFKYYFERLGAEHPRWGKNQIATIIKLLWRKRNKTPKRQSTGGKSGLSGRQLYIRAKEAQGLHKEQAKINWKSLPHESKIYWKIKAQGKPKRFRREFNRSVKRILNSGVSHEQEKIEGSSQQDLTWMSLQMK